MTHSHHTIRIELCDAGRYDTTMRVFVMQALLATVVVLALLFVEWRALDWYFGSGGGERLTADVVGRFLDVHIEIRRQGRWRAFTIVGPSSLVSKFCVGLLHVLVLGGVVLLPIAVLVILFLLVFGAD